MNSTRIFLATYLLILFAHITLIWTLNYIPTQDGPSHIYNLAILRDLLQGGEIWGKYYTYNLQLSPNLGFQIFTYPLLSFLDPWQAEKAFLTLYICLMGLSVPLYLKAFERPAFPVSFFVFPVILNFTLLMGFYSYCIAIPFFLLAFSLAWITRYKTILWKISTHTLCGFFLFCLHLIPFILYLLALLSIFATEYLKQRNKKILSHNVSSLTPLIILLFYYLFTNIQGTAFSFNYLFSLERNLYLLADLVSFSTIAYYINAHFITMFIFVFLAWTLLVITIKDIFSNKKQGQTFLAPYLFTALGLLLIYFIFPFVFAEGAYFNQRFPWVIFLLLLPFIKISKNNSIYHKSVAVVFCVILVFIFNVTFIWKHSLIVERYMSGLITPVTRNSLIMNYKKTNLNTSRMDILLHAVSHYALAKKAVNVLNYEARLDYFPVQFRENLPDVPPTVLIELSPCQIDWNRYPDIKLLVAWDIKKDERKNIKRFFDLSFQQDNLSIWQRSQNDKSSSHVQF